MIRADIAKARKEVQVRLRKAGILLPADAEIEITDFGKNDYKHIGLGLLIRIAEPEYASKWLTLMPGQTCPNHYHKFIKETFFVMKGDVTMWLNGKKIYMQPGDKVTIPTRMYHKFTSKKGAIIEEVTNRQIRDDSCFEDETIERYMRIEDD